MDKLDRLILQAVSEAQPVQAKGIRKYVLSHRKTPINTINWRIGRLHAQGVLKRCPYLLDPRCYLYAVNEE